MPPGHLASALTPTPAGPGSQVSQVNRPLAVPGSAGLKDLAASLGLSWDHGLERIDVHNRMQLRNDRTEESHAVREIIRAVRPGVDESDVVPRRGPQRAADAHRGRELPPRASGPIPARQRRRGRDAPETASAARRVGHWCSTTSRSGAIASRSCGGRGGSTTASARFTSK